MPPAWEERALCLVWLGEHPPLPGVTLHHVTMPGLDLPHLGVAGPHPLWGNRILWDILGSL